MDELERQCKLFALERNRQHEAVGRVEKIEVQHGNDIFVMNRNISTPFDCAKRKQAKSIFTLHTSTL